MKCYSNFLSLIVAYNKNNQILSDFFLFLNITRYFLIGKNVAYFGYRGNSM